MLALARRSGAIVRLNVTPLGAAGATTGGVAKSVVDYLEGPRGGQRGVLQSGGGVGQVSQYYADSIEGPGRWIGAGAAFRNLDGVVERDSFQRVLEGRHPTTGERLVTAQGSAQRGHLAVGTATRFDESGQALYSVGDAARLLGLRRSEVIDLIEAGQSETTDSGAVDWIASILDPSGEPLIPDREISRHLEVAASPVSAEQVRSGGDSDEWMTVAEVARALRVTPQYVRRLCASGEDPSPSRTTASITSRRADDGSYRIRREDAATFAEHRRVPVARVGFDLTLTAEKSIGIVTMLSTGTRQDRFVDALRCANDVAIGYLDREASVARRKGSVVGSEGLIVASYLHGTSRALDPHPHHHNVVANAIVDDEGGVRTLDARALYRHAPAAAALATAAVRWELRDLGLAWRCRADGVWEIEGVDDDAIREFSQRHLEVDEVRRVLEERLGRRISHKAENNVALATRSPKQAVDPIALRKEWLTRADRVGLDIGWCFDRPDRAIAHDVLPDDLQPRLFADLVDPTGGLCAGSNTFGRGEVMRAIADWSITDGRGARSKVLVPPGEVERLAARFLSTSLVAEIDDAGVIRRRDGAVVSDGQNEPKFTTIELLDVQSRIVSIFGDGINSGSALVPESVVTDTIHEADVLSVEQADLVRSWLSCGDRVQCAIGRAGSGKTTTMRAAAEAWTTGGYRVVGASVKGEAARQLADDAEIEADTVAMLLARSAAGIRVLDSRTVLIVDEASTLGDRDLLRLCELAVETGATLRLIGDTAQHGSVPAGGSFSELVKLYESRTPQLATVRRLTDPGERHRADLLRSGHISQALDELEASGQLVLTASEHETHAAMLTRWYTERTAGQPHPMVHGRNRERRVLNTLAQQILIADGVVDAGRYVEVGDGRRICVGDQVVAKHGDRSIHAEGHRDGWLRNGTTGTVAAVRPDAGSPERDEIDIATAHGVLRCDRATFDRADGGIDLSYAVTSYAVQGSTADVSTSEIGPSTSRSEMYVDITRGRHNNQLFGTRSIADATDTEQHLPTLTTELVPVLNSRLARADIRTALSTDPAAPDVARVGNRRTLAGLVAAQRRGDHSELLAVAIRKVEAAVRRIAEHEPPQRIGEVLPACPTSPHLTARWR